MRKTLGTLVGEMVGSFLVPEGQGGLCDEREDASPFAFAQQVVFPAEKFARIEADHRACGDPQCWATGMARTDKIMADHLASSEFHDFIIHGRIPWPVTKIADEIREAAIELAPGGWAAVEAATTWIIQRYPEEQPEGYECRTWRQVIHETGLFDPQVRKVNGRRQAWNRIRNGAPANI